MQYFKISFQGSPEAVSELKQKFFLAAESNAKDFYKECNWGNGGKYLIPAQGNRPARVIDTQIVEMVCAIPDCKVSDCLTTLLTSIMDEEVVFAQPVKLASLSSREAA